MRALVFDFDGLIVDTEWPEYESWRWLWAEHGQELAIGDWMHVVGAAESVDFGQALEGRLGRRLDWEDLEPRRRERHRQTAGDFPLLPGVRELIREGAAAGWRIGVASSSSHQWVFGHLRRHGLDAWVETLRTRDNSPALKPAPDPYRLALADLGAEPALSLAFEDSATGVAAARAAGLKVVAVPNRITRHHDLSAAHQVLASLEGFRLPG